MIAFRLASTLPVFVVLALACSGEDGRKTVDSADGELEVPRRKGPPYEVAPVTASGSITGTVTTAAAPAATTGPCAARKPGGGAEAVVYLENIARGRPLPSDTPRRYELDVAACEFAPRVLIAAAGATLNLRNAYNSVHRVAFTFEGMKNPMLRVPFSDAGQVVPSERLLAVPGVIDVTTDQDPALRARIVVLEHPYVAATDGGQFTLDSVPPGTYALVALSAAGRATTTVAVQPGATTTTSLQVTPQ